MEKEIVWEKVSKQKFGIISRLAGCCERINICGINFQNQPLKVNVRYDDPSLEALLKEKFNISQPHENAPELIFVKYDEAFGFTLPYKHYGYISPKECKAIVFASSFGVFKSTISGFASFLISKDGYVPVHASVFATNKCGVALIGGTKAGKTTILINLIDKFLKLEGIKVLTDDWAVIKKNGNNYIAETFDPSISLREINITENPHIKFHNHEILTEQIRERIKVSLSPNEIYGLPITADEVQIQAIILLNPEPGNNNLQFANIDKLACQIINAAYHYPYITARQKKEHYKFWMELMRQMPTYSFFTRSETGGLQNLEQLRRLL